MKAVANAGLSFTAVPVDPTTSSCAAAVVAAVDVASATVKAGGLGVHVAPLTVSVAGVVGMGTLAGYTQAPTPPTTVKIPATATKCSADGSPVSLEGDYAVANVPLVPPPPGGAPVMVAVTITIASAGQNFVRGE